MTWRSLRSCSRVSDMFWRGRTFQYDLYAQTLRSVSASCLFE
jgi:hypothetical protein